EVLLSEGSSSFDENNKGRTSSDHYKAMFGSLIMLRTIARKYIYTRFHSFKNLKVHFIHIHNNAIRHWSMFAPSPVL
ncbi:uncharacterized protein EV154DRAFT_420881, partial [Mucor mucedo]|uniref:uncharacterized protein n=1 Tax=Mucor mucedo TaxID=29922 RepID=UPI00221FAB70